MSAPANSTSGEKRLLIILGALLIVVSLGWLGYVGTATIKPMWKLAHKPKLVYQGGLKLSPGMQASLDKANKPPAWSELFATVNRTRFAAEAFGGIIGLLVGVQVLQTGRKMSEVSAVSLSLAHATAFPQTKSTRRAAKRYQSCNVLQVNLDSRQLWAFSPGKNGFNLTQQQTLSLTDPLPARLVGRDWKTLFQPRLNIAWLPVEQVFLRVAQLPVSTFDETLAMVELQLEKLSPLPVTQMVWSVEIMPQHADNLQTVIVTMMARDLVEKFLGDLEGKGFLADRLELPVLDQLLATRVTEDGAYIYPYSGTEKFTALAAWWQGGVLRSLGLVHVPTVDGNDAILKEQLAQMAWSGELEGWLKSAPRWHLVADDATAKNWQPLFMPWVERPVAVLQPLAEPQLAATNANRAARAQTESGMLPIEYVKRYAQEFHDRLWMRGLAGLLVVYLAGVTIYMAAAAYRTYKTETLEQETSSLARTYTNALQLKAQMEILQNRQQLKFASLDCWEKTAELLPTGVTVQSLGFKDGKHYSLSGVAGADKSPALTDFNEALRKATINGQPMFEKMDSPQIRLNPGGSTVSWNFSGDLARVEETK